MLEGHYSVIRCVPDPARGETFNIGILIWSSSMEYYHLSIDPVALRRAEQGNTRLARNAFAGLEELIYSRLRKITPINHEKFENMRNNQSGIPFVFGEANIWRSAKINLAIDRLMARLVRLA